MYNVEWDRRGADPPVILVVLELRPQYPFYFKQGIDDLLVSGDFHFLLGVSKVGGLLW